jgi:DNA-directed RNA polymerase specialized sigma subunit
MLTLQSLTSFTRHRIEKCVGVAALLADVATESPLAGIRDGHGFVTFFDTARAYKAERDAALSDLVRLFRSRESRAVSELVTYAFLPCIKRVACRLRRVTPTEPSELLSEAVVTVLETIRAYDPDRRSPHVQANVEITAYNVFFRKWQGEQRAASARESLASALAIQVDAASEGGEDDEPVCSFPCVPGTTDAALDVDDLQLGQRFLAAVVNRGLLSDRDAAIVDGFFLRNQSSAEVGARLGVDRRTVTRHAKQAKARIRAVFTELLGTPMPALAMA